MFAGVFFLGWGNTTLPLSFVCYDLCIFLFLDTHEEYGKEREGEKGVRPSSRLGSLCLVAGGTADDAERVPAS